jgi:putative ABC transport system permease protein
MRLSNIAHLYRVRLKARVVLIQELLAVAGIAVGVALLFASQVASASLDGSVAQITNGVVGASQYQLRARGPNGFSEAVFSEVRRLSGVRAAVPVLELQAQVTGPAGTRPVDVIASDARYIPLAGSLLRHFTDNQLTHARALALPVPLAAAIGTNPFETVTLQVGARRAPVTVAAELSARDIGPLADSPVALAPLLPTQRLAGLPRRINHIFVQVDRGRQRQVLAELRRIAGGRINVEPADFEATLFSQAAGPVDQSTKAFAGICALVGFMFAYCAMLLTIELRRNLIQELRRSGATRWETVKTLLFDALVLAAVASVVGIVLGDILSIAAFSAPPGFLAFAFPVGSARIVTWQSVVIAVAAGIAATCVGVLTPALSLWARARPSAPRRAHGVWTRANALLLAGACVCLAITTAILLFAPQSAILGVAALLAAIGLLLAPLLDAILAGFERLQGPFGIGAASLAAAELRAPDTRLPSLAIAATAAVAVFGSVTIQGSHTNLQEGLDRSFSGLTSVADVWVAPSGSQSLFTTVPFTSSRAPQLARLPGVRSVGLYRGGFLEFDARRVWVLAPPTSIAMPIPPNQVLEGSLPQATARLRAGGWAAISQTLAAQEHLRVGDTFVLPAPRTASFRVAALTTNLGWPPGAIILNAADYARAWESADPSAYAIGLAPGASPARVSAEIRRTLGPGSGLDVQTAAEREQSQRAASRQGLSQLTQITALALVGGVLATATVMGAMIWQRRRRFARLKVQGYQRRILWQALVWESTLLIGTGCIVGASLGVCGQLLLSRALVVVTGFPVVLGANALVALASFALVTVAAGACIAVAGYRAAGVAPYPWPST